LRIGFVPASLAAEYHSSVRLCRTQNQFNRLHIELEVTATPGDLAEIASIGDLPEPSRAWLRRLEESCSGIFSAPKMFSREVWCDSAAFYRSHCADRGKHLLVGFCGNKRRPGLPLPYFLQSLPADRWDVVLLRKKPTSSYTSGLEGLADDLPGVLRHVRAAAAEDTYRGTVTFGTSGGGYAAVAAAILIEAARGISVGGSWPGEASATMVAVNRALKQLPITARKPELLYVHGAGCEMDRSAADAMLRAHGGRNWPVEGVDGHAVLPALLKDGKLAQFLAELLEPPYPAAQSRPAVREFGVHLWQLLRLPKFFSTTPRHTPRSKRS
jgi:hypothetical protein